MLAAGVAAAEEHSVDEDAVRAAVEQSFASLVEASRALDVEEYLSHFDRDHFTALNADGTVVHSFADFEDAIRAHFTVLESYEALEFDRVKVTVLDADTAILVNEYRAVVRLASGTTIAAEGGGTQVWRRVDGDWKLVSVSSSAR